MQKLLFRDWLLVFPWLLYCEAYCKELIWLLLCLLFSEKVILHLLFPAGRSQLFPDRWMCYGPLCKHTGWLVVCMLLGTF